MPASEWFSLLCLLLLALLLGAALGGLSFCLFAGREAETT
jgi:hypothetical protein